MKYVWILLLLICSSALSQEGVNSFPTVIEGLQPIKGFSDQIYGFEQFKNQDFKQFKFDSGIDQPQILSEIIFNTPKNLPAKDQEKIKMLFKKIQDICPSCSTGATLGGETMTGLNVPKKSTYSLFDTGYLLDEGGEYIRIKKSEYELLKQKEALYNSLINK